MVIGWDMTKGACGNSKTKPGYRKKQNNSVNIAGSQFIAYDITLQRQKVSTARERKYANGDILLYIAKSSSSVGTDV